MKTIYQTNNMYLASYLVVAPGVNFVGTTDIGGARILFGFEPEDAAKQQEINYYNHNTSVDALSLTNSLESVKNIILDYKLNRRPSTNFDGSNHFTTEDVKNS